MMGNSKVPESDWNGDFRVSRKNLCTKYQIVPIFAEEIESSKKANVSRDSSESFNEEMIGLNLLKKRIPSQLFPYEFCESFQASYSTTYLCTSPSGGFFSLI